LPLARGQVKENAHVLDVMSDYVGRMARKNMHDLSNYAGHNVNLPFDGLIPTEWARRWKPPQRWLVQGIPQFHHYEMAMSASSRYWSWRSANGAAVVWNDCEVGMARIRPRRQVRHCPAVLSRRAMNSAFCPRIIHDRSALRFHRIEKTGADGAATSSDPRSGPASRPFMWLPWG